MNVMDWFVLVIVGFVFIGLFASLGKTNRRHQSSEGYHSNNVQYTNGSYYGGTDNGNYDSDGHGGHSHCSDGGIFGGSSDGGCGGGDGGGGGGGDSYRLQ